MHYYNNSTQDFSLKRKTVKILIAIFIILSIIFPFIYNTFKYINSYDFDIIEYKMDVEINDAGDLHITESVTNQYFAENTVFFKNLIYSKNNSLSKTSDVSSLVEDVSLKVISDEEIIFDSDSTLNDLTKEIGYSYNGDYDELGNPIQCENNQPKCEMIFYRDQEVIDEITTFVFEYTILGAVTSYGDISELNWKFLGQQPMNVENIEVNVYFPNNSLLVEDFKAYGHGVMDGDFEFLSNSHLKINVPKTLKGEFVEMRILMPNSLFPNIADINSVDTNRYQQIVDMEEDVLEYGNTLRNIQDVTSKIFYIYLLFFILAHIYIYRKYDKEFKSDFTGEYYRELPANYEPAIMGYMYRFKEIEDDDLVSTLLDLIRRKYLTIKANNSSLNDKKANFVIYKNKDMDLKQLKEYERYLIEWFIDIIGDGNSVDMDTLKKYPKKEVNAIKYNNCNKTWINKLKIECKKFDFWDSNLLKNKKQASFVSFLNVTFTIILLIIYSKYNMDSTINLMFTMLFLTLASMTYIYSIARRNKKSNDEYVKWKAFKKFLTDFSNIKDYPIPSLVIWEHYLVYATSLGVADKVMDQLKLKFSDLDISENQLTYSRYFFGRNYLLYSLFRNNIVSLRSTAANTINVANAARSAGGRVGGGGFGGGSSFGGGGGSFGGR